MGTIITKYQNKKLEIGTAFDEDQELEITILDGNDEGFDLSVWLDKKQVKLLIKVLKNIDNTNVNNN